MTKTDRKGYAALRELERFRLRQGLSYEELEAQLAGIEVPVSVFNDRLAPLESIVKYLHETKKMRLCEIARLLGRDQRVIGVTYRRAAFKMPERLPDGNKYMLPVNILADRSLSVLEHIARYLKERYGLRFSKIAGLMQRDDRTIWTVHARAEKKAEHKDELGELLGRLGISRQEALGMLKDLRKLTVPVTVFSRELAPLESIVKYLHENLGLRLCEIAEFLARDQRAIGITYKRAKAKVPETLVAEPSRYEFPAGLLSDKSLSVLEHIASYLKDAYGLRYSRVAGLMRRDDRTIWTVHARAEEKLLPRG